MVKQPPKKQKGFDTMANTSRLTQRDYFSALLANAKDGVSYTFAKDGKEFTISAEDMAQFATDRIAQLDKKNSAERKPTATQLANIALKNDMMEYMRQNDSTMLQASDLIKSAPCCAGLSNQKVSTMLNQLVKDGLLFKVEDKRKTYFVFQPAE